MKKTGSPSIEDFKKVAFENEAFREGYANLPAEFDLADQLIIARRKVNMSQTELASKLHTKQPAITRFENGGYTKASLETLQRYAEALGYDLHISLSKRNNDSKIERNDSF